MSHKSVLVLALLVVLLVPWVPAGQAQVGVVDVSVGVVRTSVEPVTNVTTPIQAVINTTGAATVRITFAYADGAPVSDADGTGVNSFLLETFPGPESRTVTLNTYRPTFERRGPQQIVVTAEVQGQPDADISNNTRRLDTFIRHPSLNLTFEDPATLDVVPQGEAHLRYFVRNDGNFPDNATAELRLDPGPWSARTYGPLPVVPPGGSVTGIVLVRSTHATDVRNLSLNVSIRSGVGSAGDAIQQAPLLRGNESLFAKRPTVQLSGLAPTTQIFPGEERSVPFLLRNTGDLDLVFYVAPSLVGAPAGWTVNMTVPPSWQANLTTPANASTAFPVALRPGASVPLQVNVTRALGAPNATATLRLEANATSGDRIDALAGGDHRSVVTGILTDAGPDLTPSLLSPPVSVYQGDRPTYRVEVRNVGRDNATNATLRLELRDNLRAVEESVQQVSPLGPGNATVLTWSPSTAGLRGAYVLIARVEANATQQDRNPENNTLRQPLDVRAPSLAVRAPEIVRIVPGGRLSLSTVANGLSVENLGAHEEVVVVRVDSAAEWLRGEWRLTVPAGAVHPVVVDFDVPLLPGIQRAPVTLAAAVEGQERFSASTVFTVEVDDVDRPALALVSPAGPTRVGNETRLAVRATDASGIGRAEVILRLPSGESVPLPLQREAGEADVFSTRHTPYVPGAYALEFRVEDGSGRVDGFSTLNATWTVEGSRYQGLKPVNFGDGAFVGRLPLRLDEVAPGTTRNVLADTGDGLRLLPPPYEITLPPVEGPRTIFVRATATDGSTWEGRWNVTVDLTPPKVDNATTKDAGAGKVDLSVRAEGAQKVTARFQTETGPVEVPLAPRSGGIFGASVAAPGSWDSVTFIAEDQAGNTGDATVQAPKQETPFVAPLLAVALLAVLALARRRRA